MSGENMRTVSCQNDVHSRALEPLLGLSTGPKLTIVVFPKSSNAEDELYNQ